MNRYGQLLMAQWRRADPQRFSQIPNPEEFFGQKGMELEIRSPDGRTHQGDCYVTMTSITWCPGRVTKANGVSVTWDELAEILASKDAKKAALKAARSA